MNDQFLYDLKKDPRHDFRRQLYIEIQSSSMKPVAEQNFRWHKWAIGFGVLIVFASATLFVPPVKAFAVDLLKKVGILTVEETDQKITSTNGIQVTEIGISEQDARSSFPVVFNLPIWVPESYSLDPQFSRWKPQGDAQVDETLPYVNIQWESERGFIRMVIYQYDDEMAAWVQGHAEKVGVGSAEEVYINGNPAALITGQWTSTRRSDGTYPNSTWSTEQGQGSLIWIQDELYYLMYWGSPPENASPLQNDEIIRMAESIP